MRYYYLELSDGRRIPLTEEQNLKIDEALNDRDARFIKIGEARISINHIKRIDRDYDKEDLEERTERIKKMSQGKDHEGLKKLEELKKTSSYKNLGREIKEITLQVSKEETEKALRELRLNLEKRGIIKESSKNKDSF